jgi:hypothetical protein
MFRFAVFADRALGRAALTAALAPLSSSALWPCAAATLDGARR